MRVFSLLSLPNARRIQSQTQAYNLSPFLVLTILQRASEFCVPRSALLARVAEADLSISSLEENESAAILSLI